VGVHDTALWRVAATLHRQAAGEALLAGLLGRLCTTGAGESRLPRDRCAAGYPAPMAAQGAGLTNCRAWVASCSQRSPWRAGMVAHSRMRRPSCLGSKRAPIPDPTSWSTWFLGSFTTSSPPLSMAKVLPPTLSPGEEPNPVPRAHRRIGQQAGGKLLE
jgi:hypothetical protein